MSLTFLLVGLARAEDPPPEASAFVLLLNEARANVVAHDWAKARLALDQAYAVAPANDVLVLGEDLARLEFYRGVIEWRAGDKNKAALDAWRRAAILDVEFQPDRELLPDTEEQDAYYAILSEAKGYAQVDPALPEDPGGATIFVDGKTREVGDFLLTGNHYVQIRCEDESLVGSWYSFGAPPPDWLVLCRGGSYPGKGRGAKRVTKPPPVAEAPPPVAVDRETAATAAKDEPVEAPDRERKGFGVAAWSLVAGGAVMLGGGAAVEQLVFEPLWQDGQAANATPGLLTADAATQLESQYRTARLGALGLLGAGGVVMATGLVVGVVDAHLYVGPGRIGLTGSW